MFPIVRILNVIKYDVAHTWGWVLHAGKFLSTYWYLSQYTIDTFSYNFYIFHISLQRTCLESMKNLDHRTRHSENRRFYAYVLDPITGDTDRGPEIPIPSYGISWNLRRIIKSQRRNNRCTEKLCTDCEVLLVTLLKQPANICYNIPERSACITR